MGENKIFIRLKDIKKGYGDKKILDNVNLEIKKGEIIGILGKSGAGKTTLLKTIIGFLKPDKGNIFFKQRVIEEQKSILSKSDHFENFGFSTQEKSFYSKLTVKENLAYFGALHNILKSKIDQRINEVMQQVDLVKDKDTIAGNLSQGMQKRLDIACSIMHDPLILIVDEPTADLDPGLRNQIWKLIKNLNSKSEKTIIISSHIPEDLFIVCNKMFLLQENKLKQVSKSVQMSKIYNFSNENK